MIERSLYFHDDTAFDITATQNHIHRLFETHRSFHQFTFDAIIRALSDCRFDLRHPLFIPDPFTGGDIETGTWFDIYGIEDERVVWAEQKENHLIDDDSVGTFDITQAELYNDEDEPTISAQEEEELVIGAHILTELGHEGDSEQELFDSFVENN